ncbi:MAG: hypothetical protein NXI10_17410 [bacterium]|nr:hypothetical protein [bacterium]
MRLTVLFYVITLSFTGICQDSCSDFEMGYTDTLDIYYHENGQLTLKRKVNHRGVSRSKSWNCQGQILRVGKHYPERFGKRNWTRDKRFTYYPNGQIKTKTITRMYGCMYKMRGRKIRYDESGKRIRD